MKLKLVALASMLLVAGSAFAQAKAEPDYTLSFNAGVVSDYRYRGISQSRLKPAVQGGIDFAHKSGFYLGTWASTIRWIKDTGGSASVEVDLYGGYKFSAGPIGVDVGALRYLYSGTGSTFVTSPNTTELYAAGTWGPATLKYSHAVTNLFGFANSKDSYYLDLSATFDLGSGFSLVPHIGYQKVKNTPASSYTDYSLTLAKDFGNGFSATVAVVDTDNDTAYISPATAGSKNLGKSGVVLGVKYAF
jgi:uncharacterized protein (TIGR02001 family)